jgi:hypothetical protein
MVSGPHRDAVNGKQDISLEDTSTGSGAVPPGREDDLACGVAVQVQSHLTVILCP